MQTNLLHMILLKEILSSKMLILKSYPKNQRDVTGSIGESQGFLDILRVIGKTLISKSSNRNLPQNSRRNPAKVLIVPNNLSHTVPGIIEAVDFTIGFQKLPNVGLNQSFLEVKATIKIYKKK